MLRGAPVEESTTLTFQDPKNRSVKRLELIGCSGWNVEQCDIELLRQSFERGTSLWLMNIANEKNAILGWKLIPDAGESAGNKSASFLSIIGCPYRQRGAPRPIQERHLALPIPEMDDGRLLNPNATRFLSEFPIVTILRVRASSSVSRSKTARDL
jgi:hypothetical protein